LALESGVSKQISREGDLVMSDDIVNIAVERAIWEMAQWEVQLMKLFYDKEHYVRHMGPDGELVESMLSQDLIADGICVSIKANSTDKITRRNTAMALLPAKAIDPLSLFEDLDVPNPKERVKRLITFLRGEADGWSAYSEAIGLEGMAPAQPALPAGSPAAGVPAEGLSTEQNPSVETSVNENVPIG
jgi:hypothetical protein